eukprot:TRINITY_DN65541_c0_g1_i1.p1 TRINITY_DN65541_c0_g1~~TRINITY_DN65541_c0_g1_i1.p1  ORF type:complete len:288 (+),score=32.33 TRINITY_DN65541_c0_g1_i1:66-929(+)
MTRRRVWLRIANFAALAAIVQSIISPGLSWMAPWQAAPLRGVSRGRAALCERSPHGQSAKIPATRRAAIRWGPLGPAEAANAVKIYLLPFVDPIEVDNPATEQLVNFAGPLAPLILGLLALWIQGQINNFRREQEMKVAGEVAKATGSAVAGAAGAAATGVAGTLANVAPQQWAKLVLCLALDVAGDATFLLPGIGELGDVVFAPLQALALRSLFGGFGLPLLGAVEEILPGTDVIPSATTGWVLQTFFSQSPIAGFLGIEPPATVEPPSTTPKDQKPEEISKKPPK